MRISWKRYGYAAVGVGLAVVAGFALPTATRAQSQMPSASSVVKPQTYVSLDPVPQGKTFEAAVVVDIATGFHMNSHKPSEDYLIATTITPAPPPGISVVDTMYPAGQLKTFTFSPKKPLDVYTGSVTLRLKLAVDAKTPVGTTSIPVTLRYQACNDTACLPPVKMPVVVRIDVGAAGTSGHRIHPEIFTASPKS